MSKAYSRGVNVGDTNLRVAAYDGGRASPDTIVLPARLKAARNQVAELGPLAGLLGADVGGLQASPSSIALEGELLAH